MTSLLVKNANEIAESMAKSFSNEEFTKLFKMSEFKKLSGQALENFKKAIDVAVQKGTDLELVYTNHLGDLQKEENVEEGTITKARQYMSEKAKTPGHRQPGMTMPQADDKECMSDDCMKMAKDQEIIAAEFVLSHLAKIADVLDGHNFKKLANILDETMQKISFQKK
jgi:ketol-acid reductoisomerase